MVVTQSKRKISVLLPLYNFYMFLQDIVSTMAKSITEKKQ